MATVVNYVRGTQQTFSEKPFSTADSIVLAQLVYMHMPPVVPRLMLPQAEDHDAQGVPAPAGFLPEREKSAWDPLGPTPVALGDLDRAEWVRMMAGGRGPDDPDRVLLETALRSRRFRGVRVANAVEPVDVRERNRFAALTYDLGNGTLYIAFRGTDGTFAGWHEDYRLLFTFPPLPSQEEAARYTKTVLQGWQGAIILGGHSMGGNLAAYVGASAPKALQDRILAIYEHDSPGFVKGFLATPGFQRIRGKIHKTVPESSMVGMLFDSGVEETIVRSNAHGVGQHHMTSWLFDDTTLQLSRSSRLNHYSLAFANLLNNWQENVSVEGRRHFIDDLFEALYKTGAVDFPGLVRKRGSLRRFREAIRAFPESEQEQLKATLRVLMQILLGRAPGGPEEKPVVTLADARRISRADSVEEKTTQKTGRSKPHTPR